ncbi:MAG TPA: glycosyltransferase family 2 protein [Solirubrobacteraceae bacterium]|jgi:glycosyltransferase involved in cell wall biosynthesis|nr:glycosyltransferase family 2 protein [Solirubrobacteraceae bacterium]
MNPDILIVLAARDEADRIAATLAALERAFPGAPVWVADDGSTDATPERARAAGARVVRSERGTPRRHGGVGKGQAMSAGVRAALASVDFLDANARARIGGDLDGLSSHSPTEPIVLLCDGDLGDCARELSPLVDAIERGEADLAVAAFSTRVGGGFGLAVAFARWAIRRRCGLSTRAPISGQRALRASVLRDTLPFAPGFGMEVGMTIDAVRAGHRVVEIELDLAHRATGRTLAGFLHRARQLIDFMRAYMSRAGAGRQPT